jgi:hypothetical protein
MDWSLMATLELDEDVVLGENAQAQRAASSEVSSYEAIPLHDLTHEQIKAIIHGGDFQMLHARNKQVGMVFHTFTNYFERFAPFIAAMRGKIKAPRGSHRQTEVEPGIWMTWSRYCRVYFGVTSRWIEQLLADEHKADEPEVQAAGDVEAEEGIADPELNQVESPKLGRKDRQIIALGKELDKLKDEIEGRDAQIARLLLKSAEAKYQVQQEALSQSDDEIESERFGFVLDYFKPIITPLSFFSEIDRVIRECGMQEHGKTVMVETEGL